MDYPTPWSRKPLKPRKTKPKLKPRIPWKRLGLSDPAVIEPTAIDTIRSSVTSLASRGLGDESRLRSAAQKVKGRGRPPQPGATMVP